MLSGLQRPQMGFEGPCAGRGLEKRNPSHKLVKGSLVMGMVSPWRYGKDQCYEGKWGRDTEKSGFLLDAAWSNPPRGWH